MDPIHEARIRERAYQLWVDSGRPDNMAEHFWVMAEREMAEGDTPPSSAPVGLDEDVPGQLAEDITGYESGKAPSRGRKRPTARKTGPEQAE